VVFAAATAAQWVPLGIAVGMSLITMAYMIGMTQRVFRGAAPAGLELDTVHEVPATMRVAMMLLAAAMLAVGLLPGLLDPLLDLAART
jgi:NADH:ubiquinone oxidoreductase subunit 5 (subunit L)/multisubunit Na+/H+ antiporter MnhA subunit